MRGDIGCCSGAPAAAGCEGVRADAFVAEIVLLSLRAGAGARGVEDSCGIGVDAGVETVGLDTIGVRTAAWSIDPLFVAAAVASVSADGDCAGNDLRCATLRAWLPP